MKSECCHQHPDNGSDLAVQTEAQTEETDLRDENARLQTDLKEAKAILSDLPDHSDVDAAVFEANALRAENARLQARVEEVEEKLKHCGQEDCMGYRLTDAANWVREERLTETKALAERRRDALEPFVKATQNVLNEGGNAHRETVHVRLGDIRLARAALASPTQGESEPRID